MFIMTDLVDFFLRNQPFVEKKKAMNINLGR